MNQIAPLSSCVDGEWMWGWGRYLYLFKCSLKSGALKQVPGKVESFIQLSAGFCKGRDLSVSYCFLSPHQRKKKSVEWMV